MNRELGMRCERSESKANELLENLTQSLAHEDLFKLQVKEVVHENETLRVCHLEFYLVICM